MLDALPLLLVFAAVSLCGGSALRVGLVSDPHYDPGYGTSKAYDSCHKPAPKYGRMGCDAPKALITSFQQDMEAQAPHVVIVNGDAQRHKFSKSGFSINDTFGFVVRAAVKTVQSGETGEFGLGVAVSLGNNDMVPNYHFDAFKQESFTLKQEEILVENGLLAEDQRKSFRECGYYQRVVSPRLRIIVLNTVLWCFCNKVPIPDTVVDPCHQMKFLESSLEDAKKENAKVIIISHVPPYIDVWGVLSRGAFGSVEKDMYWKPSFQERYHALVAKHASVVVSQIFGHIHHFLYQVAGPDIMSFTIPSLTPLYGNVPSYFIAELDDVTMKLKSLRHHYLDKTTWRRAPDVESTVGNLSSTEALTAFATKFRVNSFLWRRWIRLRSGGGKASGKLFPKGTCNTWCRNLISCTMTRVKWEDIKSCTEGSRGGKADSATEKLPAVAAMLLFAYYSLFLLACSSAS
ncbi:hypothetical protein, conserved [Trypanosoma brucei gambiense DAL972]|uniref:Calcineurin-like phosphoesterase domain-containing protein n=2 Tax=Trypanosoma brucei TaxID=5691 RepID=C9ZLW4_TRYB9|nr:hypothetical protein, conserved [Trypanosoma brucei gambiense DAL972]RHW73311.1 Calcineurin-like phosphoesterase [Trypanosoma brucei equiperdum]CBH10389.1 hypothetical protein, conserved [Trypanosoma brucei gambiense DAL972]|eukprot:XP_011772679.1 hypothetical protein, conserved [Trypanosoma brucei gambiense DAL972]